MSRDLTDALAALTERSRSDTNVIKAPAPRGPQSERESIVVAEGVKPAEKAGSIASPLVETAFADREWHPERTIFSTDGVIALRIKAIKSIKFKDAKDADVTIEFKT